ncbi:hypothetical protein [Streptomyces nitrosporeus]|uniref:hypothetical protein n=1 Tax=Streptomyces nitrosporeus TaxID=28894 RepID=UPI00167C6C80|nr:hypothetical protein [Streptomyces nitrosporeus]
MTRTVLPGPRPAAGQDDACPICSYWTCRCAQQQVGADELRVRALMIAAMERFGWGRSL